MITVKYYVQVVGKIQRMTIYARSAAASWFRSHYIPSAVDAD